jgi:hypothetical protein
MAAWRIADKRAKDAGEAVFRPEAVEAANEELKRHLRVSVKIKPVDWAHFER